ncbi:aspartate kinase [Moorena producens JHB]|uniref:aspartate kinase n=1 Tax=Moorena producens (strain JHB) TaxID=1454205 RepID=A0A1D9FZT8_MOOP1|nr:aspartate kinase [Moorena producens]AOY80680.1 aspartate kinase [Moorena producens JHB]
MLIIQKYGGTSVGSVERIKAVAQRVKQTVQNNNTVVVVVSAMGKTTDDLLSLSKAVSTNPSRREMDMLLSTGEQVSIALLSMALQELGQPAISLTGAQVRIITDAEHGRARILEIQPKRIQHYLNQGTVVVVAGFQGMSSGDNFEITTLGRGGSDISAVALGAALKANLCEIYTDVPGIFTTDPRIVPEAQLIPEITCDEMLELASLGAKVLHPRAVEIARNYGVPLVVRSSWNNAPGTRIISPIAKPRSLKGLEINKAVYGVELETNQVKVARWQGRDRLGVAAGLFGEIARENLDVNLIIQSIQEDNGKDIALTVVNRGFDRVAWPMVNQGETLAAAVSESKLKELITSALYGATFQGSEEVEVMVEQNMATVAITGTGMIGRPGVAAKMFSTLAEAGVNIEMISTSELKITCVINAEVCDRAVAVLCQAFEIDRSVVLGPDSIQEFSTGSSPSPVCGAVVDLNQACITIRHVRDQPGMAAKVFGRLAQENISVDMIIQSQRCHRLNGIPTCDIAFTVAQADAEAASMALKALALSIACGEILVDTEIAKVSLVGGGMVAQPEVVAQFFEALAQQQITIEMMATSDTKISCVVAQEEGIKALNAVHKGSIPVVKNYPQTVKGLATPAKPSYAG